MPQVPLSDDLCQRAVDAFAQYGSKKAAAEALGIPRQTFQGHLTIALARGFKVNHGLPEHLGFNVKGVSTLYGADGSIKSQWVKEDVNRRNLLEALESAVEAMCADIKPVPPIPFSGNTTAALATVYSFFDYHLNMLAWHKEGGADWDIKIAQTTGLKAMQALTAGAPPSEHAIVDIGGDFLHHDGNGMTPTSGHIVDSDGRFGKAAEVSIYLIRQLVSLALQRHQTITLLIQEGNHDIFGSLWLRKMMKVLYENEPRVIVHDSELPYYAIQWGQTMLGFHHGHLKRNGDLPLLFAAQFPAMWGVTRKRYIHTGHRHHKEDKEHAGARVIQHPTLAARDAYAARGGWISERAITAMTFHKLYGEVGTVTVSPEMLEAA